MRTGRVVWAAASSVVIALHAPGAFAATRLTAPAASTPACSTTIAFGDPAWHDQRMTFRATADITCPIGVAFSAALRSASGCELRSNTGGRMRYELFSDPSMQSPLVSCERQTGVLSGTGRRSFIMYGRVDEAAAAAGQFHDVLLTSITP